MTDRHTTFTVDGVRVTFPFAPYDIQREYIESVIKAVRNKQNALLESPTGTGKTLSLLCSTLAWQQSSAEPNRMIYYTSRTHIQLNQAAKELKRTAYARVPATVIASRIHMCMNDEVKSQALGQDHSINRACNNAIKKNACSYFNNYEQKLESRLNANQVFDIEDLYNFGRTNQCCPYYASKKIAETKASIVFMPYNYLLDLAVRRGTQLKLDSSIIIFDEGHNIESALKDSASAHFSQIFLKAIQDSCEKLPSKLNDILNMDRHGLSRQGYDPAKKRSAIVDEFSTKKPKKSNDKEKENKPNPIEELAEKLTNDRLQQVNRCATTLLSCKDMMKSVEGQYINTRCSIESIFVKLRDAGVEFKTADNIITTLDSMASFWSMAGVMSPHMVAKYISAISSLSHFISLMFPPGFISGHGFEQHVQDLNRYYAAYLMAEFEKETILASNNKLISWDLNLWCLHPAVGLKRVINDTCVIGPRSLIITSGTLAPMNGIELELETKFQITKQFKHLINQKQFKIMILGESPKGYDLTSTYEATKKIQYSNEIGETLLSLFRILPYGTLVFFPSYTTMKKVVAYWKSKASLWDQMCKTTKIFIESQNQPSFSDDMINFKRTIDDGGKAVFIGVCRGKLSEGTNLEANHCRNVVITGLPFPSKNDPRIVETQNFHAKRGDVGGSVWYTRQMKRALNQAIGRVIRSKNDFGMLFLCDPRFTLYRCTLSDWVLPFYPGYTEKNYVEVTNQVKEFFSHHNIDISTLDVAVSSTSSQNNVFEMDKVIRKPRKRANPTSLSSQLSSYSDSQMRVESNTSDSVQDKRVAMLASYTVDRETFQRLKNSKLTTKVDSCEPKKPRTLNSLFDQIQQVDVNDTFDPIINIDDTKPNETKIVECSKINDASTKGSKIKQIETSRTGSSLPNFKCYICMNNADKPYVINCDCARVGCYTCLKGLNKKNCGECGKVLKFKNFKPKLFNMFQKRIV